LRKPRNASMKNLRNHKGKVFAAAVAILLAALKACS